MARRIGPLTPRHKLAMANLARAYPDMPEAERREIAVDMWGNMSRLAAEYVFLDQMFDFDPDATEPGRIEVGGVETFFKLRDERQTLHRLYRAHRQFRAVADRRRHVRS
jgi:KDO2-lipid IV(A) lauroyltransferase